MRSPAISRLLLGVVTLLFSTIPATAQNVPPKVFAGFPQIVGVHPGQTANVTLTAHASDPDGDSLIYAWRDGSGHVIGKSASAQVILAPTAVYNFSVTATDSGGASASDSTWVTVRVDTTPPVVAPPHDLTIGATDTTSGTATVSQSSGLQAFLFLGGSAEDDIDPSPQRLTPQLNGADIDANTIFPEGQSVVTFRWSDDAGNVGTATAKLDVVNDKPDDLFVGGGLNNTGYYWTDSAIFRVRNGVTEQYCDLGISGASPNEVLVDSEGRVVFLIYTGGSFNGGAVLLGRCDAKNAAPEWIAQFKTGSSTWPDVPEAFPGATYASRGDWLHLERVREMVSDDNVNNGKPHRVEEDLYVFDMATGGSPLNWQTLAFHTNLKTWDTGPDLGDLSIGGMPPGVAFHDGTTYEENGDLLRRIKVPLTVDISGSAGNTPFHFHFGLFGGAAEIHGTIVDDVTVPNVDSGCPIGPVPTDMPLVNGEFSALDVRGIAFDPFNGYKLMLYGGSAAFGSTVGARVSEALFDAPDDPQNGFTNPVAGCAESTSLKFSTLLPLFEPNSGGAYSLAHLTPAPSGVAFIAPSNGKLYRIDPYGIDDVHSLSDPIQEAGGLGEFPADVSAGDTSAVVVRINSPVNVLVTDASGKRIGVDANGNQVNDFGQGGYDSGPGEPRIFAINNPAAGNFTVQAVGYESGPYTIDVYAQNWDMPDGSHISITGTTSPGLLEHHDFAVTPLMQASFIPHNQPPTANAGPVQTVTATSADGAVVNLDGSGSTDPDGDPLTYTWAGPFGLLSGVTITPTLPIGTSVITLTTADPSGATSKSTVTVNVLSPPCAIDASSTVSVVRGGFRYNFMTGRFVQTVTLTNSGTKAIAGPVSLILDSLSSNATLYAAGGTTECAAPLGSPSLNVNVGTDGALSSGESAQVTLQFVDTTKTAITYTTRVLAGSGTR